MRSAWMGLLYGYICWGIGIAQMHWRFHVWQGALAGVAIAVANISVNGRA